LGGNTTCSTTSQPAWRGQGSGIHANSIEINSIEINSIETYSNSAC
jgi:hypothetical protein